jgi:hypothetical protein
MKKQLLALVMLVLVPVAALYSGGSALYPWPSDYSFYGLASWSQPLISSGTALPADANAYPGDVFILTATPTAPTLWRRGASTWHLMSGASSGGGVSTHSLLVGLAFADSGHTGFAAEATLTAHLIDQTDPHGATMTVSQGITVGSGTQDAQVYRVSSGVVGIASYGLILPNTSTPTAPIATGTLWYDGNAPNRMKVYDGTAWQSLW